MSKARQVQKPNSYPVIPHEYRGHWKKQMDENTENDGKSDGIDPTEIPTLNCGNASMGSGAHGGLSTEIETSIGFVSRRSVS